MAWWDKLFGRIGRKGKKPEDGVGASTEELLPEAKKSRLAIQTGKTNTALVVTGSVLVTMLVGSFFFGGRKADDPRLAALSSAASLPGAQEGSLPGARIPPQLATDPSNIVIQNAVVGEETAKSVALEVANSAVRVLEVEPSVASDSLNVDGIDCTTRAKVEVGAGCTINLFYLPAKVENRSIQILVKYIDPADLNGSERSFRIPFSLSSVMTAPAGEPADFDDEDEEYDEEDEDDFYDDEEDDFEEVAPRAPAAKAKAEKPRRVVYPDDCKKFSSKVYDFSGVFVGWAVGNKDVFSPNCSKLIGSLQPDGMVVESGTGKIIGRGIVSDAKKAAERRVELSLPTLGRVAEALSSDFNPEPEDVAANRTAVRGQPSAWESRGMGDEWDKWRADDKLGIISGNKFTFVPFTISSDSQVSSGPKDERYVLRQTKPIPAVLSRPIYFPGDEVRDTGFASEFTERYDAVAVVERNVYGGDGRTIVIPAGSQLIGVADSPAQAGLRAIQKINISWTRLIRPDGAEFNLDAVGAYTADAQGRYGVAGKNDTEYMKDLLMRPLLYSALPVAMESLFPSTSSFVTRARRSDGAYQVIEDGEVISDASGTDRLDYGYNMSDTMTDVNMSSRDKMKVEIQQNWKSVANRLMEESLKQQIPFTIPAGTRIQVYLDKDVMLRVEEDMNEMFDQYSGAGAQ